ncbi:hypothetical protein [Actinoplanes sichuanensis]|uniref:DUF3592 domain-containing protein n=1 Tax=Actinoplanes sichuanensis TaxID=512349 RepID=A0ABW4A0X4_9ACTN|nr:hypothetical protein [Actinoplanes sichuanensis]
MPARVRRTWIRRPRVAEFILLAVLLVVVAFVALPLVWVVLVAFVFWTYLRMFCFPLLTEQYRNVWRRRLHGVSTQGTVVGVDVRTDEDPEWAQVRVDASDVVVLVSLGRLRVGDRVGVRYYPPDPRSAVRLDRSFGTLLGLAVLEVLLVAYQVAVLAYAGRLVYALI